MFALVNDVAALPGVSAVVRRRASRASLAGRGAARPSRSAKGLLHTQFTTRNTLEPDAQILMQLVDGPFRRLDRATGASRRSASAARACSFRVEFEFKSRLTAAAFEPMPSSRCAIPSSMPSCSAPRSMYAAPPMRIAAGAPPIRSGRGGLRAARAGGRQDRIGWPPGDRRRCARRWRRRMPDFAGIDVAGAAVGVYGRTAPAGAVLRGGRPGGDLPAARRGSEGRAPRAGQAGAARIARRRPRGGAALAGQ